METVFVIKHLNRGNFLFLTGRVEDEKAVYNDAIWDSDLYFAKKFNEYLEAETFLKDAIKKYHWGGYFQIEKYFISR